MPDVQKTKEFVNQIWDESIIPSLVEYIRIPNKSHAYDPQWRENGHMQRAVQLMVDWCQLQAIPGMKLEVLTHEERSPLLFIEIPGQIDETVLLYGHLDKQPEMVGWDPDLGPWKPVLKDGKLYGRGGADDGYACFASLAAIKALQVQKIPHARCVIIIEASEESGSDDLPYYIEMLGERIGKPKLVICLDSGCGNYQQLWVTTSLRGLVAGILSIEVLTQGIHSGQGSTVVPSTMQVLRQLLTRIEDEKTGKFLLSEFQVNIPEQRLQQAKHTAEVLGNEVINEYPFAKGVQPLTKDPVELILNRSWRAGLSIIGINDIPKIENAGNVTLPKVSVKLSVRIPPTCNVDKAAKQLKETLETQPPFGARVNFNIIDTSNGWAAPLEAPWLLESTERASQAVFGKPVMYFGEGGTIPFMGMLGKKFPNAQFLITGVLGPHSNAHGPNEFLHLEMGKGLTACVAQVIADVK